MSDPPLTPSSATQFAVLLFTDICDSTALKGTHGALAYKEAAEAHNALFERLAEEEKLTLIKNTGDGYFARTTSVAAAVRFALRFQHGLRSMAWPSFALATRLGIHAGEIAEIMTLGQADVLAPAADLAARVMSLAVGGQILLTRWPFDEARHFIRAHPASGPGAPPSLVWLAHGPYLFKGCEEPVDIFEVGATGAAPLAAPPDGEKAKRALRPGDEETLGWRPADGLEIPGRPGWHLLGKLGAGGFGEVWTGANAKTGVQRAFKFCFDAERLRALKRELTLTRLLREALGERDDIVRMHDLRLDEPPYFLESEIAPDGNLLKWAEKRGGLAALSLAERLELVAATATALAAAHSIGVLHKDIKPTNILIFTGRDGIGRPRLVDFGIGALADPSVLSQHGITGSGFTGLTLQHSSGTPTWSPPEYLAGRPFTIQGDIYSLGVMLWQIVTAKPDAPLAEGWQRDVADELLREDIAACVDGDPGRRLRSAADLAARLRALEERRATLARQRAAAAAETARRQRQRQMVFATAAAVLIAAITLPLALWALREKERAVRETAKAQAQEIAANQARLEASERNLRAARADRSAALDHFAKGRWRDGFAYLARALEYDPDSSLAAEMAVYRMNTDLEPIPELFLRGHEAVVTSVVFSPDTKRLLTASADRTARVWDAASGQLLTTLTGHEDAVTCAAFSPDASRIVTASMDKTARVWDASNGKLLATLAGHENWLTCAAFSPDGHQILTASWDHSVRVWETATGKLLTTLRGHEYWVTSAVYSPDGSRILTASGDKSARVWEAASGKLLLTLAGHENAVNRAAFSPNASRIVTASLDKTARVWDAASGKLLATLPGHEDWVASAVFSPDARFVLTASADRTARVWDAAGGKLLATLPGHEGGVTGAVFSPDAQYLATASGDQTVRIWGATNGRLSGALRVHENWVTRAAFSPDASRILTASWDRTARVWDASNGKLLLTLSGHENGVLGAAFSPDASRILTASMDQTARLWDAASGNLLLTLRGHENQVMSAAFSPDASRIVTASMDQTARVWDAASGKLLTTLPGHADSVASAVFSPDARRILTASGDKMARLWDAASGKLLLTLSGHQAGVTSAVFSPDGSRILTASWDTTAGLWDAASGKLLFRFLGHEGAVLSAAFNADATRIVTGSWDKTVRVWDASNGKLLATLPGHEDQVASAVFSPDARHLLTASRDLTVRVWEAPAFVSRPPSWFGGFLQYLSQRRLNQDGELENLPTSDWQANRAELRPAAAEDRTRYGEIARWLLAPVAERPPRPGK